MNNIMMVIQLTFTAIAGLYFFTMLKSQYSGKSSVAKDSEEEMERLRKLNKISLTEPLTEKTRPKTVRSNMIAPNRKLLLITLTTYSRRYSSQEQRCKRLPSLQAY